MTQFYKLILILLFSTCIYFPRLLKAQTASHDTKIPEKYWSIDLTAGLALLSSSPESPLTSQRPSTGFQSQIHATYHFSKRWGVYAGYGLNAYDTKRPSILDPSKVKLGANDVIEGIFGRFKKFKPTINAGVLYCMPIKHFEFLPSLGLAYTVNDWGRNRQLTIKENNTQIHYTMKGAVPSIELGANLHYWASKRSYIHLGVLAEQPLEKPYGKAVYLRGADPMRTELFKSASLAQNLFIQLGYGFAFGKND